MYYIQKRLPFVCLENRSPWWAGIIIMCMASYRLDCLLGLPWLPRNERSNGYMHTWYIYILQTPGTSLPTTRCLTWDSYGVAGVQKIFALMKEIWWRHGILDSDLTVVECFVVTIWYCCLFFIPYIIVSLLALSLSVATQTGGHNAGSSPFLWQLFREKSTARYSLVD